MPSNYLDKIAKSLVISKGHRLCRCMLIEKKYSLIELFSLLLVHCLTNPSRSLRYFTLLLSLIHQATMQLHIKLLWLSFPKIPCHVYSLKLLITSSSRWQSKAMCMRFLHHLLCTFLKKGPILLDVNVIQKLWKTLSENNSQHACKREVTPTWWSDTLLLKLLLSGAAREWAEEQIIIQKVQDVML